MDNVTRALHYILRYDPETEDPDTKIITNEEASTISLTYEEKLLIIERLDPDRQFSYEHILGESYRRDDELRFLYLMDTNNKKIEAIIKIIDYATRVLKNIPVNERVILYSYLDRGAKEIIRSVLGATNVERLIFLARFYRSCDQYEDARVAESTQVE